MSVNDIDPTTLFLGTTWEQFAQGKTLIGVDPNDTDFNASQKTGGEKTHRLTGGELPKGAWVSSEQDTPGGNSAYALNGLFNSGSLWGAHTNLKNQQSMNNLQPYITVYMWVRTA